jgi:hypothetical protein
MLIAHDCALVGNPSHTGADDIEREYPRALHDQLLLYHYHSLEEAEALRARGFRVAAPDGRYPLHAPHPAGAGAG